MDYPLLTIGISDYGVKHPVGLPVVHVLYPILHILVKRTLLQHDKHLRIFVLCYFVEHLICSVRNKTQTLTYSVENRSRQPYRKIF